jgi:ABC-type Na+ transport system ATPase subunit NatA
MKTKIGAPGYLKELAVSDNFINDTIKDLKRGQPCYAFNSHQVEKIKSLLKNIECINRGWYFILRRERNERIRHKTNRQKQPR